MSFRSFRNATLAVLSLCELGFSLIKKSKRAQFSLPAAAFFGIALEKDCGNPSFAWGVLHFDVVMLASYAQYMRPTLDSNPYYTGYYDVNISKYSSLRTHNNFFDVIVVDNRSDK